MFEDIFAKNGLSLERLHTLVMLGEAGSLIRAAKDDSGKQSRLSHHLRELSEYFGVELTERAGKSIKLTAAGKSLVQVAREQFLALRAFREAATKAVPAFKIGAADSVTQWLLVPAIGRLRRPSTPVRLQLINLRTKDIVEQLKERRLDFGLLRADALEEPLDHVDICEQRYAIIVPQRLVPSRGLLKIKAALLECPHAAIGGDGQLQERLKKLGAELGGKFVPELACDTIGQCVAAVRTGVFASVLPVQAWNAPAGKDFVVVEDPALTALSRKLVLAWHPRTLEAMGLEARKAKEALVGLLREEGASEEENDAEV